MWISLNCCPPSLFIYLAVEWNWLHTVFQLRQPFPQIRGLVFTSISWAPLQAQIFTLTSSLSGTSFQALKWWKIIQIKTAAEAQNRNLHDLYHIWDAVQKLSFFLIAASGPLVIISPTVDGNIRPPHAALSPDWSRVKMHYFWILGMSLSHHIIMPIRKDCESLPLPRFVSSL